MYVLMGVGVGTRWEEAEIWGNSVGFSYIF